MICCHISDLHLDEKRGEHGEGLDESVERLLWIGKDAAKQGAEIILVAGDTFHNSKSNAAERNAAIKVYQSWTEKLPVIVVKGNSGHDGPGEISFLGKIKTTKTLTVLEQPGIIDFNDAKIACFPFPEKAWLVSKLEAGQNIDEIAKLAVKTIFGGFAAEFADHDGPRILLSHLELGAAMSDSGQPMVGKCFIEIGEHDVTDMGADYYALGHIHKHQILGNGWICYPGSVRQNTFGEDNLKGYCLVDVNHGEQPEIRHVKAPGRELVTIVSQWQEGIMATDKGPLESVAKERSPGQIVRLKYFFNDTDRAQVKECVEKVRDQLLERGIYKVKLDPQPIATYRVRSEEIQKAKTNKDRLEALWKSKKAEPERKEEIIKKLTTLEEAINERI